MPSQTDLANSVRRFVNRAVKLDRQGKEQESAMEYVGAAEQALAMAWVNAGGSSGAPGISPSEKSPRGILQKIMLDVSSAKKKLQEAMQNG